MKIEKIVKILYNRG